MVRSSSCTRSRPPSDRPLHLIAHSPAFARTLQYGQWSSPRTLLVGAFSCDLVAAEAEDELVQGLYAAKGTELWAACERAGVTVQEFAGWEAFGKEVLENR